MLNFSDAFGPVSLSRFAANPTSAHLFRVQHEVMVRQMDAITFEANTLTRGSLSDAAERALNVANSMTSLRSVIETHQVMEAGLVHKVLAGDPRQRMVAEQFEREAGAVVAEIDKLLIVFGAPSTILDDQATFAERVGVIFGKLKERFKAEERDLFPVFDRLTAGSPSDRAPAAPLPPMEVMDLDEADLVDGAAEGVHTGSPVLADSPAEPHGADQADVAEPVSMVPTARLWVAERQSDVLAAGAQGDFNKRTHDADVQSFPTLSTAPELTSESAQELTHGSAPEDAPSGSGAHALAEDRGLSLAPDGSDLQSEPSEPVHIEVPRLSLVAQ